jgi:hypothetical protein
MVPGAKLVVSRRAPASISVAPCRGRGNQAESLPANERCRCSASALHKKVALAGVEATAKASHLV